MFGPADAAHHGQDVSADVRFVLALNLARGCAGSIDGGPGQWRLRDGHQHAHCRGEEWERNDSPDRNLATDSQHRGDEGEFRGGNDG